MAYKDIEKHMLKNGFIWQQGSSYISEKSILSTHVKFIIEKLVEKNSWLNVCMRGCRQANVTDENDLNHKFYKASDERAREDIGVNKQ